METINHLNQQLHDCQKQYSDLITNKSNETFQQLTRMTEDKEKLEQTCEELQVTHFRRFEHIPSFILVGNSNITRSSWCT